MIDRKLYLRVSVPSALGAAAVAVAACLLEVPGVLIPPMVVGAGHVACKVALRRVERRWARR